MLLDCRSGSKSAARRDKNRDWGRLKSKVEALSTLGNSGLSTFRGRCGSRRRGTLERGSSRERGWSLEESLPMLFRRSRLERGGVHRLSRPHQVKNPLLPKFDRGSTFALRRPRFRRRGSLALEKRCSSRERGWSLSMLSRLSRLWRLSRLERSSWLRGGVRRPVSR